MPLSLYKFIIVGRKPTKFGTHSIKPHSSFNGTTLCKSRIINDLFKIEYESNMYQGQILHMFVYRASFVVILGHFEDTYLRYH